MSRGRVASAACTLLGAYLIGRWVASIPWLWHPLGVCAGTHAQVIDCKSYNFWSGSASDLSEVTLAGAAITMVLGFWHQHNCHVAGCWRLQWHAHPDHGHPVCRRHHPDEAPR